MYHERCLILVFLTLSVRCLRAEGKDNKGKEFIFGFMDNFLPDLEILITTDYKRVTVNISTPLYDPDFFSSTVVEKGQVVNITFDNNIRGIGTETSNKGIFIQAEYDITVIAVNKYQHSSDAFLVFPISIIGETYYIISWQSESVFLIVATENDTVVDIILSNATQPLILNGVMYTAGMTFSIHLNKFQTFHAYNSEDFSGTYIKSNHAVTVISGNRCVVIGSAGCDHTATQLAPIETYGKQFVAISMPNCDSPSNYRIIASENYTDLNITGMSNVVLENAGIVYTFKLNPRQTEFISASKAVLVAFFAEGSCENTRGDPAMMLIPPVQLYTSDYIVTTVGLPSNPFKNFLTIVIHSEHVDGLISDNLNKSLFSWRNVEGSNKLVITDFIIEEGPHTIYHTDPTATFLVVSTGIANSNSYAFVSGQRFTTINSQCFISKPTPGDHLDNDCDGLMDEELQDHKDTDKLASTSVAISVIVVVVALISMAGYVVFRKIRQRPNLADTLSHLPPPKYMDRSGKPIFSLRRGHDTSFEQSVYNLPSPKHKDLSDKPIFLCQIIQKTPYEQTLYSFPFLKPTDRSRKFIYISAIKGRIQL